MAKVIIIEDEPAAVNELKILMEQEEGFQFMGHAGTLRDALKLIRDQQPDLVFMDINLYDCMAFDILNEYADRHDWTVWSYIGIYDYDDESLWILFFGASNTAAAIYEYESIDP